MKKSPSCSASRHDWGLPIQGPFLATRRVDYCACSPERQHHRAAAFAALNPRRLKCFYRRGRARPWHDRDLRVINGATRGLRNLPVGYVVDSEAPSGKFLRKKINYRVWICPLVEQVAHWVFIQSMVLARQRQVDPGQRTSEVLFAGLEDAEGGETETEERKSYGAEQ